MSDTKFAFRETVPLSLILASAQLKFLSQKADARKFLPIRA